MTTIEKIRAEIERRRYFYLGQANACIGTNIVDGLDEVLAFLDNLPEQPVEGLDVTDFCKPVDPGIAKCVANHWWELLDDENAADKKAVKEIVKTVRKEITKQVKEMVSKQPVKGLEEEIHEYNKERFDEYFPAQDGDIFSEVDFMNCLDRVARHFYELGLNSKK